MPAWSHMETWILCIKPKPSFRLWGLGKVNEAWLCPGGSPPCPPHGRMISFSLTDWIKITQRPGSKVIYTRVYETSYSISDTEERSLLFWKLRFLCVLYAQLHECMLLLLTFILPILTIAPLKYRKHLWYLSFSFNSLVYLCPSFGLSLRFFGVIIIFLNVESESAERSRMQKDGFQILEQIWGWMRHGEVFWLVITLIMSSFCCIDRVWFLHTHLCYILLIYCHIVIFIIFRTTNQFNLISKRLF